MSNNGDERRGESSRRQIDQIEEKLDKLLKIINGNGQIGLVGKVDIIWGYRVLFVATVISNFIAVIFFVTNIKGG